MIEKTIALTRMRRDLNTVVRKLVRGEVDVFIVTYRGTEKFAIVRYETVERWCRELEDIIELSNRKDGGDTLSTESDADAPGDDREDME